jgi:hypothetical protein
MSGLTKKKLPPDIQKQLDDTKEFDRGTVNNLLAQALQAANEVTVSDLWEQPELAMTYWILLISGTNQEEETEIAKALLSWKAFNAKDSAMVLCLTLSDSEYKLCAGHFKAVKTPTLVMSDARDMYDYLKIDSDLLFKLMSTKGSFQRFITELHLTIQMGDTIQTIKSQLRKERAWAGVKILYSEAKSIVSISISASTKDDDSKK